MRADPRSRPPRASRGLVRSLTGLALAAVVTGCGLVALDRTPAGPPSATAPVPAPTAAAAPPTAGAASPTRSRPGAAASKGTGSARNAGLAGPYTLRIPRIGVDARVVAVASNADRVLLPPRDPKVPGWWSGGAAPGAARGSAVLVGHTVHNGGGGVFDHVGDLDRGDAIEVDGAAASLRYRVRSVDVLSKDEVAREAEQIFAQSGAARLVIITCDDWDGTVWRSNIITVATPV